MGDTAPSRDAPRFADPVGRFLFLVADATAVAGGLILTAIILLTVASIAGRALGGLARAAPSLAVFGPVPGDFEIVSMAGAVAVAAFMPLCQMRAGHIVVDLLFRGAGPRWQTLFAILGNVLFVPIGALIARAALAGALDRHGYGETTMLLRLPAWWGPAALALCFALAVACAAYLAARDAWHLVARRSGR